MVSRAAWPAVDYTNELGQCSMYKYNNHAEVLVIRGDRNLGTARMMQIFA